MGFWVTPPPPNTHPFFSYNYIIISHVIGSIISTAFPLEHIIPTYLNSSFSLYFYLKILWHFYFYFYFYLLFSSHLLHNDDKCFVCLLCCCCCCFCCCCFFGGYFIVPTRNMEQRYLMCTLFSCVQRMV